MKKTLVLAATLAIFFAASGFCKKAPEPETAPSPNFDGSEGATVLDVSSLKKFNDRVRVISAIDDKKNFKINIYRAKTNSWEFFGMARTKGFGDTDFVDSEKKAKKCRWVAITPIGGGDYKYMISSSGTDLFITALPKKDLIDASAKAKAKVFEVAKLDGGAFKDDVEVNNTTSDPAASFAVFAFNEPNEAWTKIGDADFQNVSGSNKIIYAPYEFSVSKFKFFAIVSNDGKSYNYSAVIVKKNLVITAF